MSIDRDNIHLLSLGNDYSSEDSSSVSDDDSIEVVSNVDEEENTMVELTKYLTFTSSSEDEIEIDGDGYHCSPINVIDHNHNHHSTSNIRTDGLLPVDGNNNHLIHDVIDNNRHSTTNAARSKSNQDTSDDDDDDLVEYHPLDLSRASLSRDSRLPAEAVASSNNANKRVSKRKRRPWTVNEKLEAISTFKTNQNKRETARDKGCTTAQLRKWLKHEKELLKLYTEKKGRKRQRLNGGGIKLKYPDLDLKLMTWYRERRTKLNQDGTTSNLMNIKREKVSFKQLERQGKKFSHELKHEPPSSKWYRRFMKRHKLSLQKPKRKQKIPLSDAYNLVSSFYSYIRRASTWGPKRGPMGAFTARDVCNMDESPLELFGDQGKRSINDIGTPNDIEGSHSDKRFATLILTVFGEDNSRVGPILIFKGKGKISQSERSQYAQGVQVLFSPTAVINGELMGQYVQFWYSKVKDAHPKLLIADSANPHLNPDVLRDLRKKRVVVAVIPKGCTMYLQVLDVSVFSVFKHHYDDVVEEYFEHNEARRKTKLSASQSRILCTRLTWSSWIRTLNSIDFNKAFNEIGYIWNDNSPISLRTMPGFIFNPSSANSLPSTDDNSDDENRIDDYAAAADEEQQTQATSTEMKQLTLMHMWKNKK